MKVNWQQEIHERWIDADLDPHMPFINGFVRLRSVFGAPLGEGRHRIVFRAKNRHEVIKLPRNWFGENANMHELTPDGYLGDHRRYATTWKDEKLSTATGLLVIRMERVRPVVRGKIPHWADYVDCQQVGRNSDGRIVAYDWG